MKRDFLWFFAAAVGVIAVVTLSNAGPDSTLNAVLTLGFGAAFLLLAFRSVYRTERRVLRTGAHWTPSAVFAAGFAVLMLLQQLGLPSWGVAAGMFATVVGSWLRGGRLLRERSQQRPAP